MRKVKRQVSGIFEMEGKAPANKKQIKAILKILEKDGGMSCTLLQLHRIFGAQIGIQFKLKVMD